MKILNKLGISLFLALSLPTLSSAEDIKGLLKDFGNTPLVGYIIKNSSNNKVAFTNKTGEFSIKASKGDILYVYKDDILQDSRKITDDFVNIKLSQNPYADEINTISMVNINRERSSAAVDVVKSNSLSENSFLNTEHSIIGKLASVTTTQSSGLPGEDGLNFFIRGKNSFNLNTPLVMIDGFESSMESLSSLEIESVSILKDAVATAIYGMRGANGVVLIKTKGGNRGKNQLKVEVNFGIVEPTNIPKFVNASQYSQLVNEARANDGLSPRYSESELQAQGSDKYHYPDVNWRDEMLKNSSFVTNSSVQFTGGSGKVKYFTLLNYVTYDGAFKNANLNEKYNTQNTFNRFNFRTNVTLDITPNTILCTRIGGRIQDETIPETGSTSLYNTMLSTPSNRYVIYNADGSYGGDNTYRSNPMGLMVGKGYDDRHARFINTNIDLNQKLDNVLQGLSFNAAISFMSTFNVREKYRGASFAVKEFVSLDDSGLPIYNIYGKNNVLKYDSRAVSQDRKQSFRANLDYNHSFGNHSIQAQLFGDVSEQIYSNDTEPYRYITYGLSANYGYMNKYFVDLVASYNGSNAYNPDNRYGFFPALGASWILSKENFLKDVKQINLLKLRASYGLTGSDALGSYRRFMYLSNYATNGNYRYGETAGSYFDGLSEAAIANANAKWEKGYKFNVGMDLRMFNDLYFTIDYFREKRTGILQSIDPLVTDMVGIGLPYINYGATTNRGFDATMSYSKELKKDFSINVQANAGLAKNKIDKYYQSQYTINNRIGSSMGSIYGYVADGFYKDAQDIASSPKSSFYNVQPGDIKFRNQNNDNVIDQYDKVLIGNEFPTFHYGLDFNIVYKGIYLNAQVDGQTNYQVMVDSKIVYSPLNNGSDNISEYAAKYRWTPENAADAKLPRLTTYNNYNNNQTNTLYMKDGDFMRLRTVELGYNWNPNKLKSLKMTNLKLFVRGHNLLVLDKIDELDPEVTSGYPMLRSYSVGLNVGF